MERSRLEKIEDLAKRRGLFWSSSEIYGGLSGIYDYGPIGLSIKQRFESAWRRWFLDSTDYYEIEPANIMAEGVWVASGHISNFVDPTVKCEKCRTIHRADHIMEDFLKESFEGMKPEELTKIIRKHNIVCPSCKGRLGDVSVLNMMFPVSLGGVDGTKAYLRPETAQGAYVNFKRLFEISRKTLPLGIAVIGKAYRNEISPRQLLIRMREFTQAELQIFFDPDTISVHPKFEEIANYTLRLFSTADRKSGSLTEMSCHDAVKKLKLPQMYVYNLAKIQRFYLEYLKFPFESFRFRELSEEERAFYNKIHWDVEVWMESLKSFKEIGGLHYRTDHDLSGHAKISKSNITVTIDGKTFIPHILELSFGIDRNVFALIDNSFIEDSKANRMVLRLPAAISPYDCGVYPLLSREGLPDLAKDIESKLRSRGLRIFYDESGSIGRRYRRADEIGILAGVTVDHQSLSDGTVTLRDRDSMEQVRIKIDELEQRIMKFLKGENIRNLGTAVKIKNNDLSTTSNQF